MTTYKKRAVISTALPGDRGEAEYVEKMIRVNHAGEYGAKYIYKGQLAILKHKAPSVTKEIEHMLEQECAHLAYFDQLIAERRVRPSGFSPLWKFGGFALGAITAAFGEKAAMACTVAVEEVIDQHYHTQLEKLPENEKDLKENIKIFQEEELEHKNIALKNNAEEAKGYFLLSRVINVISKTAIFVAKKY